MPDLLIQIEQIISELFNVEVATLSQESSTETVPGWDSMGQLLVVVELEQQFGLEISPEDGEGLTSVARIERFIKSSMVED
jgi:acyl carrier protein